MNKLNTWQASNNCLFSISEFTGNRHQTDIVGSQYVRVKDEHKKDNYLFSGIRLSMLSDFKGLNNSEDQIFQKGQTDGIFTVKGC